MKIKALLSFILFLPLLLSPVFSDILPPLNEEVLGLIVFKSSLQDPYSSLSSWSSSDQSPCLWTHVQCDASTSKVIRLSLDSLSLSGAPIFRGLDQLQSLQSLSLSNNNFSGLIQPGFSSLPKLQVLDLSRNFFSGQIPEDIGSVPSLRMLDLSFNSLSGFIPESVFSYSTCSNLRFLLLSDNNLEGQIPTALSQCRFLLHLNVSNNKLSGPVDFADGMFSLTRLRVLDLSNNNFSGSLSENIANVHNLKIIHLNGNRFVGVIPIAIGLCPHLYSIDFSDNHFDGSIPYTMQSLYSLSYMSLSNNKLYGDFPTWIGNLGGLKYLDLSGNKLTGVIPDSIRALPNLNYLSFSDNLLTGAIPELISECKSLKEIRLKGNDLNGSIPNGVFNLELEMLDLSSNKFTGHLPPGSSKFAEAIQWFDASNNGLTGNIPLEMILFFNLKYLNLSWNSIRSQLPPELGSFRNLSVLDLRKNEFFGMIPEDLCESGSLEVLQLDGNSLTGPIPDEIANCSSLFMLSLSHNQLSGSIPESISQLKKLEILEIEYNNLSGEIPRQLGTLQNLLAVNISHNKLTGRLPMSRIFQTLDPSSLEGNLGLCSPLVSEPCIMDAPKPLVLDPNSYINGDSDSMISMNHEKNPKHRRFFSISTIIAICAALIIILGVFIVTLLNISARRRLENTLESICNSSSTRSASPAVGKTVLFGSKSSLKAEDLVSAESILSKAVEIGRGSLGSVYKSAIAEGRVVAIKKLFTPNIVPYHEDFDREVRVLAKAKHPNLLPIKGYYWTPQIQLLISDYLKESLQARLYDSGHSFTWPDRFNVVLGLAKGLAHLHHSFRPPIIHYNVKPSNVLLDDDLNPRVSDFGLVKLVMNMDKHFVSSRFESGMGYVAPEQACQSLRVNEKCDVYAYGVVVLEVVTGRRPVEYTEDDVVVLCDVVRGLVEGNAAEDCVDRRLGGRYNGEEVVPVLKLGLICASQAPSSRPDMGEVVKILEMIRCPGRDELSSG